MATLSPGDPAPSFTATTNTGETVSLEDFRGKTVVLYFYPKDDTPGCTKEACSFRDNIDELKRKDVVVLGVSADSVASHQKFIDKYNLPFTLLSDPDRSIIQAYGAWGEKSMYGKIMMGLMRSTVVIGPEGKILKRYAKVKTDTHAEDILADLADA